MVTYIDRINHKLFNKTTPLSLGTHLNTYSFKRMIKRKPWKMKGLVENEGRGKGSVGDTNNKKVREVIGILLVPIRVQLDG